MKASLLLMTLLVVASACNETPPIDPAVAQRQTNKSLILRFNEAQNAWDYETLASMMAPDIKRHCQATMETPVNSPAEYVALIQSWEAAVPDASLTINRMIAEGDIVAVHATFSGTSTGPMGNVPATGRHFDSDSITMFRIEDGLIAEVWTEWDNLAILTQLGLFPPAATGS